ncbi:HNH endonuclease signature motif containing protein [Bacillus toyonensis]|uniref:HNH endonuclease n=1 Tax=Bacillus toyonensis TaxID=155322 RepID=UPI001C039E56|nr:HNH endonuclease signature motif containing protein [Bacillus toyonensis]UFH98692.1 HNH endonuclease [Bacillus toyonensis]
MVLRQPIAVNKIEKPVIIFKNGSELKEFLSIQTASKWLKEYSGYKYIPYKQVENGIFFGEIWSYNGDTYAFTTDENVRLDKLKELGIEAEKKVKVKPTGFWTFFCNPQKWAIDDFLMSGEIYDTFSITEWQKNWFKKGQLGIIRVGRDRRTLEQLRGKPRLNSGVYAVVEILNAPILTSNAKEGYWLENNEEERYRVPIKYLRNLLNNHILLGNVDFTPSEIDKYLLDGFQASSMPLNPGAFNNILDKIGGIETLDFEFNNTELESKDNISELENKYAEAVPEVKERVSKYIERGTIAQQYKRKTGFKCQICDALGFNPYSFKKTNGEYYVETHHVIPVSGLQAGSLSTNNLITVCANHHRQLHYGNVKLLENTHNNFVFEIETEKIEVIKL